MKNQMLREYDDFGSAAKSGGAMPGGFKKSAVPAYLLLTAISLCIATASCAPKAVSLDVGGNVPDTPHCEFMKDACREAMAFQGRFETMSAEEKGEAKIILNAYVQQCQSAQELCRQSANVR